MADGLCVADRSPARTAGSGITEIFHRGEECLGLNTAGCLLRLTESFSDKANLLPQPCFGVFAVLNALFDQNRMEERRERGFDCARRLRVSFPRTRTTPTPLRTQRGFSHRGLALARRQQGSGSKSADNLANGGAARRNLLGHNYLNLRRFRSLAEKRLVPRGGIEFPSIRLR